MARPFFSERKTSHFPKDRSSYMSSGRRRVFSRHAARMPNLPFWGSLRLASSMTGLLELSTNEDLQAEAFGCCSPSEPLEVPEGTILFCWALVVRASVARGCYEGRVISPSSTPSGPLPLGPLFLFLSTASPEDACVGQELVVRAPLELLGKHPQCGL